MITMLTFSQRDATKIKSKQFSQFGSLTNRIVSIFVIHYLSALVSLRIFYHVIVTFSPLNSKKA